MERNQFKMKITLSIVLLFAITFVFAAENRRRGNPLRDEVISSARYPSFSMELVAETGSIPVLRFVVQERVAEQCVRIYEAVLEVMRDNPQGPLAPNGNLEYKKLPGETIRGETFERERMETTGPLANTTLLLNGKKVTTDANGLLVDSSQWLLEQFDNLRTREVVLTAEHGKFGRKTLVVTRGIIRKGDAQVPGMETTPTIDLLQAMKLDFTQLRNSSVAGLEASIVSLPKGRAGEVVPMTVQVRNNGKLPVSNLIARSFSSEPAMNGKMFYFGAIKPGAKATFTRMVTLPEKDGKRFATIAFWSALGASPEHNLDFSW